VAARRSTTSVLAPVAVTSESDSALAPPCSALASPAPRADP
jgi:hypothetical protein